MPIATLLEGYRPIVNRIENNLIPDVGVAGRSRVDCYLSWLQETQSAPVLLRIGYAVKDWVDQRVGDPDDPIIEFYNKIRFSVFAERFGLRETERSDAMDVSPVVETGMDYLRQRLSSEFFSKTDSASFKDSHIQSVLEDKRINDWLRKKVDWLLPDETNISMLVTNCHPAWSQLVAVLVEAAERGLGESDTTFPVPNVRVALEGVIKTLESVPFLEVMVYQPGMLSKDREAMWRVLADDNVVSRERLGEWTGVKPAMIARAASWTDAYTNSLFEKLLVVVDSNKKLREEVIRLVLQKHPEVKIPDFSRLVKDLFGQPGAVAGVATPLRLAEPGAGWTARAFLSSLGIANKAIEENLRVMEQDPSMFKLTSKAAWPAEIKSWDPEKIKMEHFVITNALAKAGLIE
jgi:hypothetical protein